LLIPFAGPYLIEQVNSVIVHLQQDRSSTNCP
jgi:hypothetical protein